MIENLIVCRTDPFADMRIRTIANSMDSYNIIRIDKNYLYFYDGNFSIFSRTKKIDSWFPKLHRFFQTKKIANLISSLVCGDVNNLVAIDIDVIAICAKIENVQNRILDLHENDFVPAIQNLKHNFLSYYYTFLAVKFIDKFNHVVTVSEEIAKFISFKFNIKSHVIYNISDLNVPVDLVDKKLNANELKFVHHGIYGPGRRSQLMIDVFSNLDLSVDYYFVNNFSEKNKNRNRVIFREPVQQSQIQKMLLKYDIGVFYFDKHANINTLSCLPNKFFEFVFAGLPVVFGPSVPVASLLSHYRLGFVVYSDEEIIPAINSIVNSYNSGEYHQERLRFISDFSLERVHTNWRRLLS